MMLRPLLDWWRRPSRPTHSPQSPGASAESMLGAADASATMTASVVRVAEVDDARALAVAGALFQRKFGQHIPDFPRHFVAMVGERCAGYVHYTPWQGDFLCGGLCIDDRVYRELPSADRAWIRERGGIAEIMMRGAHAVLDAHATIWGYIGDKQAEAVDRRVGFVPVAEPFLFAIWRSPLSDVQKAERIAAAKCIGPF